jgi:NTE family protein
MSAQNESPQSGNRAADPPRPRWPDQIALCLSGGGYRAALFHLGVVRRLNELALLSRVNAISSVSGGSILAACLAKQLRPWPTPGSVLPAADFEQQVAKPFEAFCSRNIRTAPILRRVLLPWNWFRPDVAVRTLATVYEKHLNEMSLGDLGSQPRFVFCATDMIFGVDWFFDSAPLDKRDRTNRGRGRTPSPMPTWNGDYQVGYKKDPACPTGRAVAASSCFPPIFNPLELHLKPGEYTGGRYHESDRDQLVRGLSLSDGGVYDNLGSQPVMDDYGVMLVSDGGAVFRSIQPIGRFALLKRVRRYTAIAGRGGGSMRKRVIIERFESGEWQGTLCGIGTPPSAFSVRSDDCYPDELVARRISEIRTDLDCFSHAEQAVLQNHGYLQLDAAARTHLTRNPGLLHPPLPDAHPPYPEYLDPGVVDQALAHSHKLKLPFGRYR